MSNSRKRQASNATSEQEATHGLQSGNPRDPNAETRPARIQMGHGLNLDATNIEMDESKYKYRWFLDDPQKPGRIIAAKAAYWEHVTMSDETNVCRPSGNSTFFLMRLPLQYWEEDLKLKKEKVMATMDSNAQVGAGEYAPDAQTGKGEGGTSAILERSSSENPFA